MEEALIKQAFAHSLKLGTGEAYLLLKQNPRIDFSAELIAACMRNLAYDRQCEGSRAAYMFHLIKHSKQYPYIAGTILKRLKNKKRGDYDLDQLADLAVLLYSDFPSAREIVLARYCKNMQEGYDWLSSSQVLAIGGQEGLSLFVQQTIDREDTLEDVDWSYTLYLLQEYCALPNYMKVLKEASERNPALMPFYEKIAHQQTQETTLLKQRRRKKAVTYAEVTQLLDKSNMRFRFAIKRLSDADYLRIAHDFEKEKDPKRLELYAKGFANRENPLGFEKLLKLAQKPNPRGSQLQYFARKSLRYFLSPRIRAFALEELNKPKVRQKHDVGLLYALVSNYQQGDAQLLLQLLRCYQHDIDILHEMGYPVREIYTQSFSDEAVPVLEFLYQNVNCSLCRYHLVNVLLEHKCFSDEWFSHLPHDQDEDIQKLYRRYRRLI